MNRENKLIKQFENDTDFIVCVWSIVRGGYAVTTYDRVQREHFDVVSYPDIDSAIEAAKKRNKAYMI